MGDAIPSVKFWLKVSLIAVAGWLVFWPALSGGWIGDDVIYITNNPLLKDPARLWKAWFVPGSFVEYYPLEETAQWIQWRLWGDETFGYHVTNLILHIGSALLVWRLLDKFGLRLAWLGGLIFVLHPMNVESVASVAELKNTLSLPPFLLAMCAYIDFVENGRKSDYWRAVGLFFVAMLCKISMAPFPFVILLYAWWKRHRIDGKDMGHAAPFLIISLVLAATTYWAGRHYEQLHPYHPEVMPVIPFLSRVALMGLTTAFYVSRFFWPATPLPMYPQWSIDPPSPFQFLPWLVLAGVIYLLWRKRKTWGRHALLGLGFFLISILPFSGLVTISYMFYTWASDHFLYIPMIGLIGWSVAALEQIGRRLPPRFRFFNIAIITGLMLAGATQAQDYAAMWTDSETLYLYTIAHNPGAWSAHYNLANSLRKQHRFDEAIAQYQEVIRINPRYDWAHNNLGVALASVPDRTDEALAQWQEAVRIRPHFPEAHNNMAGLLAKFPDRLPEAISEYQAALQDQPDLVEAHYGLGIALLKMSGRDAEAKAQFREALRLQPGFEPATDALEKMGP